MDIPTIGLVAAGAGVLAAAAVVLRSSATLFTNAGVADAREPDYVVSARATVESLEADYAVAEELHQDPATVEDLRLRVVAARKALDNALATAKQGAEVDVPVVVPQPARPVAQPVRTHRSISEQR